MKHLLALLLLLSSATLSIAAERKPLNAVVDGPVTVDYIRSVRGFTAIIRTTNCQADSFLLKVVIWKSDLPKTDANAWRVEYKALPRGTTARLCSDAPVSWTFDVLEAEKVAQLVVMENVVSSQVLIFPE